MKKTLTILLIALLACATSVEASAKKKKKEGKAAIEFAEQSYNFGSINENGGSVTHEFEFTNTGDGNLLILDAIATCGCTRPVYPHEPIAPGKKGKIKVTFLPKGHPGAIDRSIFVRTNGTPKKVTLKIKGNVIPK